MTPKKPAASSSWTFCFALSLVCLTLLVVGPLPAEAVDSCIDCHKNPRFMVTNSKLFEYFQEWEGSIHRQEDVDCSDCHGGNPDKLDKDGAHGQDLSGSASMSAVNFENIPKTCGQCHEEIYKAYRKSNHFEHLATTDQEIQGPSCVTCHGSINVDVLDVNTVYESCARCHNEEEDNHPENPKRARAILNKFLSIHRFYRFITIRDPVGSKAFFSRVDDHIQELAVTWHTFDLDAIEKQTALVLELLKAKRDEVRAHPAKQ